MRRYRPISPGYIDTVQSRLVAGRELTWADTYDFRPVALVSENMAREVWGDARAAIGKRIRASLKDKWREVIGVVADLRDDGVSQPAPTIVYVPLLYKNFDGASFRVQRGVDFLIRTPRAGSIAFVDELRQAMTRVNPNLPLANQTLDAIYSRSMARTSFTLVLLTIAGSMAVLLGVVGIYGAMSYSVSQRTREIGIRIALGASVRGVTGMFIRHGLMLSALGAGCGLLSALD